MMKRPLIATALAAAAMLGSTVMVHAQEPSVPQCSPSPPEASEMAGGLHRAPLLPPAFPPDAETMQGLDAFDLAGRLAAAEIYIGVKPEQLEAWRSYAAALLDLVSSSPVQSPSLAPDMRKEEDARRQLPGEELSLAILEKAEKAKVLQGAIDALKSKLAPAQIDRLAEAGRVLVRRPPPPHIREPDRGAFHAPEQAGHGPKN